ncbi:GntR family transcriptional regulator [Candidatus Spongiisocius sp.]|uniref:GntR family transcriptional regulator n=1 Tax=Candidatus Spongiisocius sp. TaxID=3101273 RepID=UPI003B5A34B5
MTSEPTATVPSGSLLTAVAPVSAEEAVTAALRDAILSGRLVPGERLAQAELAGQLGVSRIPLRDALRRLEEEALVRIDGRRGAWVTALTTRDIAEVYELRIMLEGRCIRYAVENLWGEEELRAEVLELSRRMDEAGQDVMEGRAARREFYYVLYSHAGRPRMHRLIMQLRDNVGRYHVLQDTDLSHAAHSEVRRCIESGNGDGAARAVTKHLEEARNDLLATMTGESPTAPVP